MNISRRILRRLCMSGAAALLVTSTPAAAVGLTVIPSLIYQSGTSGAVYLGHTVDANTNYNRLVAGGSYTVTCNSPSTLPLTGQRTLSTETFGGPTILVVTIPATLPSLQSIPGWSSVSPDTELACTYAWTARAVEGGYSIGAFGISFQTGNGERTEGGTLPFRMFKPDRTDDGCIKS
jgi:hypothetical protein